MVASISGLREIAGGYDAFLVDQFGVLHDGERAFDGAVEALRRLRDTGARIGIVSNSGKRSAPNRQRLARLGFDRTLYDALVTSGEIGRRTIQAWLDSGTIGRGAGVQVISRDGDRSLIDGLDLRETVDAATTELLIVAGAGPEDTPPEAWIGRLRPLARRRVRCICVNPDLRMYTHSGIGDGPGALARRYAALGGPVTWLGKPWPEIFRETLAILGGVDPRRTLVIGDSPSHDLAGAQGVGCPWLFVTGGVYAADAEQALAESEVADRGGFTVPAFRW